MNYCFGEYILDTQRRELHQQGHPVALRPKVFDVLAYLVRHPDQVVGKQTLLTALWPHVQVSPAALSACIKLARQAVGDSGTTQQVIQTCHGRGYRFVAPVVACADPPPGDPLPAGSPGSGAGREGALRPAPVAASPATPRPAAAPPAPKAHGSMLFVSHDLQEAADGPKASAYALAPGATKLPCILETKIISDVEGFFTCRVTTNVYDTKTGRHLLVPQGSTVLGNDQANTLVYGSNRMDTVSLTLALPDGRTVDLGRAPVTDQQGVAGLTGDVNNHYWKLFGAVLIGGALKGGMSAFQIAATEAAGAGQVTSGLTTLGNQATTKGDFW